MAKKPTKQQRIEKLERKYDKLIDKLLKSYYDKSMGELWEQLDILKEQMAKDLKQIDEL